MACPLCPSSSVTNHYCRGCGLENINYSVVITETIKQGKGLAFAASQKDCEDGHPLSGSPEVARLFSDEYKYCSDCGLAV